MPAAALEMHGALSAHMPPLLSPLGPFTLPHAEHCAKRPRLLIRFGEINTSLSWTTIQVFLSRRTVFDQTIAHPPLHNAAPVRVYADDELPSTAALARI